MRCPRTKERGDINIEMTGINVAKSPTNRIDFYNSGRPKKDTTQPAST